MTKYSAALVERCKSDIALDLAGAGVPRGALSDGDAVALVVHHLLTHIEFLVGNAQVAEVLPLLADPPAYPTVPRPGKARRDEDTYTAKLDSLPKRVADKPRRGRF